MFGDKCTKPHQTGMESKWEGWVKETINFLQGNNVDTYEGGWNANSLEGMQKPKGKVMEIPQRLNILQEAMNSRRALFARSRQQCHDLEDANRKMKRKLAEANAMIESSYLESIGAYDAKESLGVSDALAAYTKEHLPHLMEDEDDDGQERRN
jgi:hypothetical protein